jgi:tetratricopeptide (TPR) repeat protein
MKRFILFLIAVLGTVPMCAQTVFVKDTVCLTYPFSDPDPVPKTDKIYPYYRFETFAFKPVETTYKMVILENEWLRVKIFPEIGGKIWSVYDKKQRKEMFYDNDVVKFREIALRGPWTSGGIEFNYGVIGHAPSCSHPVDYSVEKKADGSVSCYIGVSELLTRSRWMVEINLPKDAVWVRTRSFWHNYSGEFQPYYAWANSGVKVTDDMRIIYPGTQTLEHDGVATPYPIDAAGNDLSVYARQAFGGSKSLHPVGSHKGYFGAYWPSEDYGVMHYALRDEKLGRKYFSWAQSAQGAIWRPLLTDQSPQYVELQSGRLFNQNRFGSVETPYKQTLFAPYGTDEWNEYWLPVAGIGDVDDMTLKAAVNVSSEARSFSVYPYRRLAGVLKVMDASGGVMYEKSVDLQAAEPFTCSISSVPASIYIDGFRLWSSDSQQVDRPYKSNPDFDITSAEGQMHHARFHTGMRNYAAAEQKIDKSLELDPSCVQALTLKALICMKKLEYAQAYEYASRALAIDNYDAEANYISGEAAVRLGKYYDALDRFEVAAITNELRSAAYTHLAVIHFKLGDRELAEEYAGKSLVGNGHNVSAYMLLYQISPSDGILNRIRSFDPLGHFADIEKTLAGEMTPEELRSSIQEEMFWQNYLEAAAFYHGLDLNDKALKTLEICPESNALIAYWKAYLSKDKSAVAVAESQPVDFVFPFRHESANVLEWAVENGGGWKSRYLYAMLSAFFGDKVKAAGLLNQDDSDYAPYYAYRGILTGSKESLHKALELDPKQWRYSQELALMYYKEGDYVKSAEISGNVYLKDRTQFRLGDTYIKSLIALQQYAKADREIERIEILPFEGQGGSHVMWRDIKLHLAAECIDRGKYKEAALRVSQSREWPESLGVGKPYDNLIDSTLEDWMDAVICRRTGDKAKAADLMKKVASRDKDGYWKGLFDKVTAKTSSGYVKVTPLIENLDASKDKKLF